MLSRATAQLIAKQSGRLDAPLATRILSAVAAVIVTVALTATIAIGITGGLVA